MSKNMTAASTWTVTCRGIADGDPLNSANLADIPVQDLLNRTEWQKDAFVTQMWPAAGSAILDPGIWSIDNQSSGVVPHVITTLNAGAYALYIPIRVPAKGAFSSVAIQVTGAATHAGVPASKPTLSLWKSATVRASKTQIGATITDSSANVAAYDADHWITLSGLTEVIAADTTYWMIVTNEAGANAAAQGLRIGMCKVVFTP